MKLRTLVFIMILTVLSTLQIENSSASVYVAEPYLVQQPSYAGMMFYVYTPHGMEKGWCLTFDGYAVTQVKDRIWVYGTMQSGTLTKTSYAVGSVNPALAGIIPYFGAESAHMAKESDIRIAAQPLDASHTATAKQAYIPDWSINPSFLAVSNWKNTVDRIGILRKYNIPVAWKGDDPTVIYAWTGKSWKQIHTRGEDIMKTINKNLYGLLKTREKSRLYRWYAEDIPILTEKTIGWGYIWMGEIFVKN